MCLNLILEYFKRPDQPEAEGRRTAAHQELTKRITECTRIVTTSTVDKNEIGSLGRQAGTTETGRKREIRIDW